MPYFPTFPEWQYFVKRMTGKGFRFPTADEKKKYVRGYGFLRPRSRRYQEPGEICFIYEVPRGNDYRIIVWTTKREGGWVSRDSGWVIMIDGSGQRVHTSRPHIRRSSNFLLDLFTEARDMRWRVIQRPEHCGKFMNASHPYQRTKDGKIRLKASLWRCAVYPKDKTHVRAWNNLKKPFPELEQQRIEKKWEQNDRKNKKTRDQGKEPYAAFRSRIKNSWIVVKVQRNVDY